MKKKSKINDDFFYLSSTRSKMIAAYLKKHEDGKLRKGKATDKLLSMTSEGELSYLIGTYRQSLHKSALSMIKDYRLYPPRKELKQIAVILGNLGKTGWLKYDDMEAILFILKRSMLFSEKGAKAFATHLHSKNLKTKGRPIKDPEFKFLVVVLATLIKEKSGNDNFKLIWEFLTEQNFTKPDDDLTPNALKKVYLRACSDFNKLERVIKLTYLIYELQLYLNIAAEGEEDKIPSEFLREFFSILE